MKHQLLLIFLVLSIVSCISVLSLMPLNLGDDYAIVDSVVVTDAGENALLSLSSDGRYLDMYISSEQGLSIDAALRGIIPTRPLTHDLQVEMLRATGTRVLAVSIDNFVENYFTATLYLRTGPFLSVLDCRPSDCTALALRTNAPIYLYRDLLSEDMYNPGNISDIIVA